VSTTEHAAQSHHLPAVVVADQQRRAVLLFILGDAVFFGCLVFSYLYLRSLDVSHGWLPADAHTASRPFTWAVAAVTVLSAAAYWQADKSIRAGNRGSFQTGVLGALLLAAVATAGLIVQISTWSILMSDGSYASAFIVMTWVQLVHLLILLLVGVGIANRGRKGKFDDGNSNHVRVVGYFWYWVTVTSVVGALTTTLFVG